MQNVLATAPTAEQVWTLELDAELGGGRSGPLTGEALEPMVELMLRTRGVRSVAVSAGETPSSLAVWVSLVAGAASDALGRATALVAAGARYAGLRGLAVGGGRVAEAPAASSSA